ncbi:hypothetical protein OAB30_03140 [Polaribacter sp.]|jgi:hypothetical protein|nr:hypothetical protein [Polaribacter sp.]MDA9976728.1 hypothetical protein [Polaribacter sp.]MDB0025661.1 hypothetical protein [Polaribacter sp.]MDB4167211.1 hypothetical protein [Polaribacter sp.]MDB4202585.1 hypothetical protein [Polaribacter sp.]
MNLSKKNKFILLVLAVCCSGWITYSYLMKPPASIESRQVAFTGTAAEFSPKVQENANEWLNSIVVLEGVVTSKDENGITLNNRIYCQFSTRQKIVVAEQTLQIKGRFIGYDDLLNELKLDQCIIQK